MLGELVIKAALRGECGADFTLLVLPSSVLSCLHIDS